MSSLANTTLALERTSPNIPALKPFYLALGFQPLHVPSTPPGEWAAQHPGGHYTIFCGHGTTAEKATMLNITFTDSIAYQATVRPMRDNRFDGRTVDFGYKVGTKYVDADGAVVVLVLVRGG